MSKRAYKRVMPLRGTSTLVIEELKELTLKKDGLIRAADVVDAARDKNSALHGKFEWDDGEAGEKYRLVQARALLAVCVQYIDSGAKRVPTKVFVSLSTDRTKRDGEAGYRAFVDVIENEDMRTQLLMDSLNQMRSFEQRYKTLKELEGLLAHMKNTRMKITAKQEASHDILR